MTLSISDSLRKLADELEESDITTLAFSVCNKDGYAYCGDMGETDGDRHVAIYLFSQAIAAMNHEMARTGETEYKKVMNS